MELAATTHRSSTWTGERINLLTALVKQSVPYEEIARRFDVSVGSVCGKVHRLKIGRGDHRDKRAHLGNSNWAQAESANLKILADQDAEAARRITHVKLNRLESGDDHCRFVLGEPADGHFCGRPRQAGKSYCREHQARCYVTVGVYEHRLAKMAKCIEAQKRLGQPPTTYRRWGGDPLGAHRSVVDLRSLEESVYGRQEASPAPA